MSVAYVCVCLRLLSAVPLRDKALEVLRGDDITSLGWCLPCLSQDWDAPRLRCIPIPALHWRQHCFYHLTSCVVTSLSRKCIFHWKSVEKRLGHAL